MLDNILGSSERVYAKWCFDLQNQQTDSEAHRIVWSIKNDSSKSCREICRLLDCSPAELLKALKSISAEYASISQELFMTYSTVSHATYLRLLERVNTPKAIAAYYLAGSMTARTKKRAIGR